MIWGWTGGGGGKQKVLPIQLSAISLSELNKLTADFGTKALIGEGSYARVFSVTSSDGRSAAIKKLDTGSSPSDPDDDLMEQVASFSNLKSQFTTY